MVFGWFRRKPAVPFLVRDTAKTLDAVSQLPVLAQRTIARCVVEDLVATLDALDAATSLQEQDDVLRDRLQVATARRHIALRSGARDHGDPEWAAAALAESWTAALTGNFGQLAFQAIHAVTVGWLNRVLPQNEVGRLSEHPTLQISHTQQ